jgi:tetratricopeptide (TPR) repeat protein
MWIAIVAQLPLSRVEQEVLRRFQEDPSGRQFLPLSDLLRNHKLLDESLELLTQGVQNHPGFAIARVVLARELFQRGLVMEAWVALENSELPLSDNILAQKLRFKMAILLGDESTARSAMQLLRIQQGVDPESRRLFDQLEIDGIQSIRDSFRADLQKKGIDLRLPGPDLGQKSEKPQAQQSQQSPEGVIRAKGQRFLLEYELDSATRKLIENFHVVPLSEVFVPDSAATSLGGGGQQVELDSTTLAEIYAKQGVYSKALSIYRRLLRMAPHNDLIRLKVSEMARLEKEQRSDDLAADPVVFERMEVTDLIDRQMRFMQGLLSRLEQNQK